MPLLRKVTTRAAEEDGGGIAVLIEPKPGVSDAEVAEYLRGAGAEAVDIIAPGFISALAGRATLGDVAEIAFVHVKATKQPRSA
jgi:hypothetical protein